MNLPNILTVSRFLLIPLFLVSFFVWNNQPLALGILLLAGLTDILDGYLARRLGQTSSVGALLDPLADKSIIITVTISLVLNESVHWLIGLAVCLRELGMIAVTLFFFVRQQTAVPANGLGKMTTVFYYILFAGTLVGVFAGYNANILLTALLAFSLIVSGRYAWILSTNTKKHTRGG